MKEGGEGGVEGGPSGVPSATQRWMSATCSSLSRRDPARSPYPGSGGQGGMKRTWVTRAICSARRRTSA